MYRFQRGSVFFILAIVLLGACTRMPDHARYIPKDAITVAGVNFSSLSKKIAWSVITGSKLFKEMQARMPEKNAQDAISGIEAAGFDFANTFYVYMKADERYSGGNKLVGLLPLADAGAWEAYVKKNFPAAAITEHGDRKETSLGAGMHIGWNKHLMIIIGEMGRSPQYMVAMKLAKRDTAGRAPVDMAAEMEQAFGVTPGSSITANKHFEKLEKEGHDISFFVNYEQVMAEMSGSLAEKMSMSVPEDLWKDAALASGVDFEKGRIAADIRYYLSPGLKDFGKAFGSVNADKDMMSRLPAQNMDMVAAMHIAPDAVKIMLEKMNLLGIANLGLSIEGLSVEGVLDAFTGDMAFVMNDFSLQAETVTDSFMGQTVVYKEHKPALSGSFVMKIRDKDYVKKLLNMAKELGLQTNSKREFVVPLTASDTAYILFNDNYAVVSNKYAHATGILDGSFKSQKQPAPANDMTAHPASFYLDVQEFCKNIDAGLTLSRRDSLMIHESKKLLKDVSMLGGEFKDGAFRYRLDINFINQDENSIIELMDYAMKMNDAGDQHPL